MPSFYASIHEIVGSLMYADNFYIALYDEERQAINFPFFLDEVEGAPVLFRLEPVELEGPDGSGPTYAYFYQPHSRGLPAYQADVWDNRRLQARVAPPRGPDR